jgi:uncharacterized protein YbjQ (UPF0145 family)
MKIRSSAASTLAAVAAFVLAGCASTPSSDVERRAADVNVYRMSQLADKRYDVVRYIWVDSWQSAFRVPTHPSETDAIAALRTEAARVGADGLVNVVCLDQNRRGGSTNAEPAVLCYGNAIRFRRAEG